MSREMQMIVRCDACEKRGEQTVVDANESELQLDLGFGPVTIDLCETDRKQLLDELLELVTERGSRVPTVKKKAGKREPDLGGLTPSEYGPLCPQCGFRPKGNRTSTINHMENVHGLDRAKASKLVPPPVGTKVIACPECGFLAGNGQGIAMHVSTVHGEEVWKKVRPKLKSS